MKIEFSLYVDGSRIRSEQYGDIKNAKKILLFCHGFPGSNRLCKLWGNIKNEPISLVEINYRGDKKSEGKFSFLGSIKDITTVAYYLKDHFHVPLYALGLSMGGFYITNIVQQHPCIFEKIILLNPVVDTRALFFNKPIMEELWMNARSSLSLKISEDYDEEIKILTGKYNPAIFVNELHTPITIVQSTTDEVLPPEIAKAFHTSLNCEKEYLEVPNAKHDLKGNEEQIIRTILI